MAQKILDDKGNPVKYNGVEVWSNDFQGGLKSVDRKKRTLSMTGSDETRDRDGDIIRVSGWVLENYIKNPVFLWAHDYRSVPLAATRKIIKKRTPIPHLLFENISFPTKGLHPFADMILDLFGEDIINASSVGFAPKKWEKIEERKDRDDDNAEYWYPREYTRQELLELSGVPVPCNPNALQNSLAGKMYGGIPAIELQKYFLENITEPEELNISVDYVKEELFKEAVWEEESEGAMVQVPKNFEAKEPVEEPEESEEPTELEKAEEDETIAFLVSSKLDQIQSDVMELKEQLVGVKERLSSMKPGTPKTVVDENAPQDVMEILLDHKNHTQQKQQINVFSEVENDPHIHKNIAELIKALKILKETRQ